MAGVDRSNFTRRSTVLGLPVSQARPPAPGNHAKFILADDKAAYVGSDNLYPHRLAEFGYLIEGEAAEDLLVNYWQKLWPYAQRNIVHDEERGAPLRSRSIRS